MLELLDLPRDVVIVIATHLPPNDRDSFCATCVSLYALRLEKRVWECPPLIPALNELLITPRDRFMYWYTTTQKQVCRGSERFLPVSECLIRSAKRVNPALFAYFLHFNPKELDRAVYFMAKRGSLDIFEQMITVLSKETLASNLSFFLDGIVASPSPNFQLLERFVSFTQTANVVASDMHPATMRAFELGREDVLKQMLSKYDISPSYLDDDNKDNISPDFFNAMAKGGHAQKIDRLLTANPDNGSLRHAIDGAVMSGRIDLFDSLVARLSNVPVNLFENCMNDAADHGHIEMVEHIHQQISYDHLSPYSLIEGLAKCSSSQSLQRGGNLLTIFLAEHPPSKSDYHAHISASIGHNCPLSITQILLAFEIPLSIYECRSIIRGTIDRGDIEIINFMLSRWSSLDLWDGNFIQQISEYSVNSGCLLTVEYILHQILKRNLIPPFASMIKQAIMNGHLHICRYLCPRSHILTPEEATIIMDETLRQNNVPIAKYVLSFLPLDQLDMPHLLKQAMIYSCNETLDLSLERYTLDSDRPNVQREEQLSYDLFVKLKENSKHAYQRYYSSLDKRRLHSRRCRIFEFIDKPMRKTDPLRLCSGITKQKRLCHRRVTKRKYCSIHANQEVMES